MSEDELSRYAHIVAEALRASGSKPSAEVRGRLCELAGLSGGKAWMIIAYATAHDLIVRESGFLRAA